MLIRVHVPTLDFVLDTGDEGIGFFLSRILNARVANFNYEGKLVEWLPSNNVTVSAFVEPTNNPKAESSKDSIPF